ncbi:MAG: SOS mutagenesis and repair protein UmuC, partial [Bacteroidales bacterium]|nr:SOS mutagenesis and repair protein UmuC [Bacteroidales bacterium]
MIIHVDCNNYYVSCERIFRPYLWNKPVVVVTNNENGGGIILALSKEAKLLGLKRGAPVYKVKELLEKNEVMVFPTNFILYNDISNRIMSIVRESGLVLHI